MNNNLWLDRPLRRSNDAPRHFEQNYKMDSNTSQKKSSSHGPERTTTAKNSALERKDQFMPEETKLVQTYEEKKSPMTNHKLPQDPPKKNNISVTSSKIDNKISTPKVQVVSDGNKNEK